MRVFWLISRKWVGRSPVRAYARLVASMHVRFDEHRRQTLRTEILRIPGYHEYAPTTTTGSDFRGIEIVSRESSTAFSWNSTFDECSLHAIFRMRMYCAAARRCIYKFLFSDQNFITSFVTGYDLYFIRAYILFHVFLMNYEWFFST